MRLSFVSLCGTLLALMTACGGDDFVSGSPGQDAGHDGPSPPKDATPDTHQAPEAGDAAKETGIPDAPGEATTPEASPDTAVPCPSITSVDAILEADGIIVKGNCQGAISFLSGPNANVGVGRGLIRFNLNGPTTKAFAEGRVQAVRLELSAAEMCAGQPCPREAGYLEVFPLRNDWDEGSDVPYSGADWCRRLAGSPGPEWNAPGAEEDHGALAGDATVQMSDTDLSIDLDPAAFAGGWLESGKLSLLLVPDGALFVFVTREASQWDAPRLIVQYCD